MPNWCSNNLSVYGPKDEMDKFIEVIKISDGEYNLLEKLYPTPEDLMIDSSFGKDSPEQISNREMYGYADWYDWRIAKWGTKWTESDLCLGQEYTVNEDANTGTIAFNFETAWSPPLEAFDKISEDWPELLFCIYYEETGMSFCGNAIWKNGRKESEEANLISRYFDEEYLYETYSD